MCQRYWICAVGALFALLMEGWVLPLAASAQDSAPSVAEAARRSREQKKKTTKPATVVTDDTLQRSPTVPAAQGQESTQPAQAGGPETATTQDSKQVNGAAAEKDKSKKAEIEALKQRIADQKESVKLTQRELALQQDTFYSNPDYAHDKAGKDRLDALKGELQQKQDALADLQSKLVALGGADGPAPEAQKF